MAPDAPIIHAGMDDNIVFHRVFGDGDVEGAFSRASLVLDKTFHFPRQTGVPLEPRGVIADYDSGQDRLTIWASCRSPHLVKTTVSNVMRLPQHSVRVISGDVGGEFGIKGAAYPESIILSFLSRKIDRPVKWVEDRMESLLACGHAHEMAVEVSVATNDSRTGAGDQGAGAGGPGGPHPWPHVGGAGAHDSRAVHSRAIPDRQLFLRVVWTADQQVPGRRLPRSWHGAGGVRHRAGDGHGGG